MEIKGFIETSLIDWDGRLAAVLFLPGCNFRCPMCHNHQLVQHPEEVPTVDWGTVEAALARHRGWIDGVVVTGGEPTIHAELATLLRWIKQLGLAVKLDTNGALPDVLGHLIGDRLVDYVAMDIKAPLDERYARAAGAKADLGAIRRSIALLMASGVGYEFRTTVLPLYMRKADVGSIGREIKGAGLWALQQYLPGHADAETARRLWPYRDEILLAMREEGAAFVERCVVRGIETVAEGGAA
ncbi:MAG: anaerobic ribonucleoside-triphosphate reductase activating protein [Candidatus Edwardsbacteria bacterium]|nr:anaerobic ribonucleoside-triphosphate reductase activating protein [Candidatus Edwardsbacteria bacterium]